MRTLFYQKVKSLNKILQKLGYLGIVYNYFAYNSYRKLKLKAEKSSKVEIGPNDVI